MKNKFLAVFVLVITLAVCLTPTTRVFAETNRVVFEFKDIKIVNGEIAVPVYITENTGDIFVAKIKIAHDDDLICMYFDSGDIKDEYDCGGGITNEFKFNYTPNLAESSVLIDSNWVGKDVNGKGYGITTTGYLGTFYFSLKNGMLISDASQYTFSISEQSEITSFDIAIHPQICFKESEQKEESIVVEFKKDDVTNSSDNSETKQNQEENQEENRLDDHKSKNTTDKNNDKSIIIIIALAGLFSLAVIGFVVIKKYKKH